VSFLLSASIFEGSKRRYGEERKMATLPTTGDVILTRSAAVLPRVRAAWVRVVSGLLFALGVIFASSDPLLSRFADLLHSGSTERLVSFALLVQAISGIQVSEALHVAGALALLCAAIALLARVEAAGW
jgi:hypothetical protein